MWSLKAESKDMELFLDFDAFQNFICVAAILFQNFGGFEQCNNFHNYMVLDTPLLDE